MRAAAFAGILVAALVASSPARADDGDPLQTARVGVVTGDPAARATLLQAIASSPAAPDRAAAAELLYVADTWAASGRPRASKPKTGAPPPTKDWEADFRAARAMVVDGRFADAAARLEELFAAAPDLLAAARARALRDLARDGAARIPPEATAAPAPAAARPEASQPAREETRWYGWQTLIADGVSIAILFPVPPAGLAGYALGGPIIHAAHGRWGVTFASLAMRVLTPPLGAIIGAGLDTKSCNNGDFICIPTGLVVGLFIGAGVAIAVDAAFLSNETVKEEPAAPKKSARRPFVVPVLAPRPGGADVGVVGRF